MKNIVFRIFAIVFLSLIMLLLKRGDVSADACIGTSWYYTCECTNYNSQLFPEEPPGCNDSGCLNGRCSSGVEPGNCVASYPGGQLSCNPQSGSRYCNNLFNQGDCSPSGGGGGCDNDGTCESGEDSSNCPGDCGGSGFCGNGVCESGETSGNCPSDCGGGGGGSCGAPCTNVSQCSFTTPQNPACVGGICWDSSCNPNLPPGGSCQNGETCQDGSQLGVRTCPAGQTCRRFGNPPTWQCNPNPECAYCIIDLAPAITRIDIGETSPNIEANVLYQGPENFTISQVSFSSSNTNVATVTHTSADPDVSAPFRTKATGVATGVITLTATAKIKTQQCTDTAKVRVRPPGPWWQVKDSDVTSDSNINSQIPDSCNPPGCSAYLITNRSGGFPGVAGYTSSYDFSSESGSGEASDKKWLVNTSFPVPSRTPDYSYFSGLASDVNFNPILGGSANNATFAGGEESGGYYWFKAVGNLTISGDVTISGNRKVVLFVEGGDLAITGNVDIQTPGQEFFMALVGKGAQGTKGNILLGPTVATLKGLYLADNDFLTGSSATQLNVRGSVVALGDISMDRDLDAANSTTPSEVFTYSPELIFLFPKNLNSDVIQWTEVAP